MNVILVSLYYQKNIYSGANKRFDETGKFLKRQGYELKVVVLKDQTPEWCDTNEAVEIVSSVPGPFSRMELHLKLSLYLKREPASFVISDFMPVPARALKKHVHLQLIHDLRNFTIFHRAKLPLLSRRWQAKQWRSSKKILTVSRFTQQQLQQFCGIPSEDVIISHNGIDTTYLEQNLEGERPVDFLYIAHFEARKNHPIFIKGLAELKDRGIEAKTVLIGKDHGTLSEVQRLIAEHELSDFIEIRDGSFSEQELIKMYLSSKVFVSPARYEGFGMPIIEALASGCLVCCSDIEVFHEVADDSALYFDPENEQDIADVLARALKQKVNRQSLRALIEEKYTWDSTLIPILNEIKKQ